MGTRVSVINVLDHSFYSSIWLFLSSKYDTFMLNGVISFFLKINFNAKGYIFTIDYLGKNKHKEKKSYRISLPKITAE